MTASNPQTFQSKPRDINIAGLLFHIGGLHIVDGETICCDTEVFDTQQEPHVKLFTIKTSPNTPALQDLVKSLGVQAYLLSFETGVTPHFSLDDSDNMVEIRSLLNTASAFFKCSYWDSLVDGVKGEFNHPDIPEQTVKFHRYLEQSNHFVTTFTVESESTPLTVTINPPEETTGDDQQPTNAGQFPVSVVAQTIMKTETVSINIPGVMYNHHKTGEVSRFNLDQGVMISPEALYRRYLDDNNQSKNEEYVAQDGSTLTARNYI